MKFLIGFLVYLLVGLIVYGIIGAAVEIHMHPEHSRERITECRVAQVNDAFEMGWKKFVLYLTIVLIFWPFMIVPTADLMIKAIEEYDRSEID